MTDTKIVEEKALSLTEREQQKLNRDVLTAKTVLAQKLADREAAPDITVGTDYENPLDKIARQLIPGLDPTPLKRGEKRLPGKFREGAINSAKWFTGEEKEDAISDGWVPFVKNGIHRSYKGVYLYSRPIVFAQDIYEQSRIRTKKDMESRSSEMADAEKSHGGTVIEDRTIVTKGG